MPDIEDIQKNVMTAMKAIQQQQFQKVFNSNSIVVLSARLLKGSTSKMNVLSIL
jgi:hypothetical protein